MEYLKLGCYNKAFLARLAYEINCIRKYDYPKWMGIPSRTPIKGERMEDFAMKYGTTIKEMKECLPQVESFLRKIGVEHE